MRVAVVAALISLVTWTRSVEATEPERLKRTAAFIQRSQSPSGLLQYDFDFLTGSSSGQDNAVRQAGVTAFLAEYFVTSRDAAITATVSRALERLELLSLPIQKGRVQAAVEWTGLLSVTVGRRKVSAALDHFNLLYQPRGNGAVVSLDKTYAQAAAGATALALLAELQYAHATGDARFEAARARWLHGLAALYVSGHGFRVSPTLIHVSPFADGEGWLALAYYERHHPGHPTVASMLPGVDTRLMAQHQRSFSIMFYQWGTMAAALRWDSTKDARFARFIKDQAVNALQWLGEPRPYNTCATIEGLATAARVLRDVGGHHTLLSNIERRVNDEMRKNYDLQILARHGRMDVDKGVHVVSPRLDEFDGAFLYERHRPYTRIDVTGHCLSAMVKLQRYESRQ